MDESCDCISVDGILVRNPRNQDCTKVGCTN